MAELTLEENIRQILPTLPLPIQKFFEQRKLGEISRLLMERYALHIDQGAVLERELMLLLIGLETPDEFAEALYAELPISKQTVRDIITDINQEVFVPLREEMKKGAPAPSARPPASSEATVGTAKATQGTADLRSVLASVTREGRLASLNPAPSPQPPRPSLKATEGTAPSRLLEDHEEPHIEFHKTAPPPTNLPGAIYHPPIPKPPFVPPPAPIKQNSSDPYREPFEP